MGDLRAGFGFLFMLMFLYFNTLKKHRNLIFSELLASMADKLLYRELRFALVEMNSDGDISGAMVHILRTGGDSE